MSVEEDGNSNPREKMLSPESIGGIVGEAYARQAADALRRRAKMAKTLVTHRKWPEEGWDDGSIELV